MARVLQRVNVSCPNCGSSKVLREKQEIAQHQKNARCQNCGFLILKSDIQIVLEAIVTAVIYVSVIYFHLHRQEFNKIETGFLVLGMIGLLGLFPFISRMPNSAASTESRVHLVTRHILDLSKWVGVLIVAYVFAVMK